MMRKQNISLKDTGRFSQLICDYLSKNKNLQDFYGNYPNLENSQNQIKLKKDSYSKKSRKILVNSLNAQYAKQFPKKEVSKNLELLANENTFTVTTGHQLCLMTGPLYFIYKIISTINLCKQLKIKNPESLSMRLYNYLMEATNCKIIMLTGTPIINYPNEVGILFNILRGFIKTCIFH